MDSFIQIENFSKISPYASLFWQGMLVTVMLSLFTVAIGFILALILSAMRMSRFYPLAFLGLDKEGHQREKGFGVALGKFNPISFIATAYVVKNSQTVNIIKVYILIISTMKC